MSNLWWCDGKAIALMRAKFESGLPPILSGLDVIAIQHECTPLLMSSAQPWTAEAIARLKPLVAAIQYQKTS